MKPIEIKPGVELNWAVAAAIGMRWYGSRTIMEAWWHRDGNRCCEKLPFFSTDLNDTFMAADEIGLFEPQENTKKQGLWISLRRGPIGWTIVRGEMQHKAGASPEGVLGKGDTPALAICAAILKLKNE